MALSLWVTTPRGDSATMQGHSEKKGPDYTATILWLLYKGMKSRGETTAMPQQDSKWWKSNAKPCKPEHKIQPELRGLVNRKQTLKNDDWL